MRRLRRRVTRSRSKREIASRRVAPARIHLPNIDRKTLLLGTALASTLLVASFAGATPAAAVTCPQPPGGPILIGPGTYSITCVNVFNIYAAPFAAIDLRTTGDDHFIKLDNSGNLSAGYYGIRT